MAILHAYNGSVIHALLDLFPDIKFDESKFSILRRMPSLPISPFSSSPLSPFPLFFLFPLSYS